MLERFFHELNTAHFGGALPLPKLLWNSRLASTAGRFRSGSRNPLLPRPPEIEVASYLRDLPDGEEHIRDTILHEMIHYFLWHEKRPFGHTAEFLAIMKAVGARRYNTVPKLRPVKHHYECPHCLVRFPARRKLGNSACAKCCERYNYGKFSSRFLLRIVGAAASPAIAPRKTDEEGPRLPPSEIIRRLEELKQILRVGPK